MWEEPAGLLGLEIPGWLSTAASCLAGPFGPSLQRGYVSPNLPCSSDPHFTDRVRRPSGRTWEGKYQDPAISCLVDPILYLNTFRNVSLFI